MYAKEEIEKLIPNSTSLLEQLYNKYNNITWTHYFYIDNYHEDYYIAISSKGDILYNIYYSGIIIPEEAFLIERRFDQEEIELDEHDLYMYLINEEKDIRTIQTIVDKVLRKKCTDKYFVI